MLRFFNPKFMKVFYPLKTTKYIRPKRKGLDGGGYQQLSKANGICPEYIRVCEAIKDEDGYAYLERPGMQLVRHQLPNIQKELAPHRFLFYGPAGIGKRISMAGCLAAAYESNNFIIFFVPNALDLRFIRNWGRYRDGRGLGWGNEDRKEWSPPKICFKHNFVNIFFSFISVL